MHDTLARRRFNGVPCEPRRRGASHRRLEESFGKEAPLMKTRVKVHAYLGMTIDSTLPGKGVFTMIDYIQDMLGDLPEDMDGEAGTPAGNNMFAVNGVDTINLPLVLETDNMHVGRCIVCCTS